MYFSKICGFTNHALKSYGKNKVAQITKNLYTFVFRALIKAVTLLIIIIAQLKKMCHC